MIFPEKTDKTSTNSTNFQFFINKTFLVVSDHADDKPPNTNYALRLLTGIAILKRCGVEEYTKISLSMTAEKLLL